MLSKKDNILKKNKVLFLVQLPPPVHGASHINSMIKSSLNINSIFNSTFVDISPGSDMRDLGKISPRKILSIFVIILKSLGNYLKNKPDLVYITLSPLGAAFYKDALISMMLKLIGAKIVYHMHGKGIDSIVSASSIKLKIYKIVFRNVDVIHLSEKLFFDIEKIRDKRKKLIAVPNGVHFSRKNSLKMKSDKITFIFLSNIVPDKGPDILIKATKIIPKRYQKSFDVKIFGASGDDSYLSYLKSLIDSTHETNIILSDARYGEDKINELCKSDVFILPTLNDCFPLVILEAMSLGLAVISSNQGAITDIVEDNITGETLDACTPETLAEKMVKYIKNQNKITLHGEKGKEKFLREYTSEIFEKKMVTALNLIISRRHEDTNRSSFENSNI
jgi:glycosyltransferase involved in cell wall biosynthesis